MRAVHATHRRRWGIAVSMLLLASLASTSPAMAGSARSSTPLRPLPWGKEIQISGHGDPGVFTSLSCAASGDCTAVGYWSVGTVSVDEEGFILDEEHGRWGRPFAVPGLTASQRLGSTVVSVSCRAPGWCVAGGSAGFGFVVDEQRGVWGRARREPGPLAPAAPSTVGSVSCAAPGDCVAAGQYGSANAQGFVVDEVGGTWGRAQDVPGLATLSGAGASTVDEVSCTADGDCAATGSWWVGPVEHAFVVDESRGTWGSALAIPGVILDGDVGSGPVFALSCAAPGDCAATGTIDEGDGMSSGFLVDEVRGRWGTARQIPGLAALNEGDYGGASAVSCWATGSCDVVGMYSDGNGPGFGRAFLVEERAGRWRSARTIPGIDALTGPLGSHVMPTTISCDATGDCAAGGIIGGGNFLVDDVRGVWHDAADVRNGGGTSTEVSCVRGDHCVVATDAYRPTETGEVASGPRPSPRG